MQNSNSKIILSIMFLALFTCTPVFGGALDISRIGFGGRSLALGRAQVAGDDIGASFVNPATFADFDNFRLTSMYVNLAEDVNYSMIGAAVPIKEGKYGCLGIGYIAAGVSGIITTSSEVRSAGISSVDYRNSLFILSYAKEMNQTVKFGAAAKFSTRSFDSLSNATASGADMDIGFLFYPKSNFIAGLSLQNVLASQITWKTGAVENNTTNIKMGINYKPGKNLSVLADLDSNQYLHSGVEWSPKEFLFLRCGLESVPTGAKTSILNYSLGVGMQIRGFSFDYAYYLDTVVLSNSSHFFSISYAMPQKVIETPPIFQAKVPSSEGQAAATKGEVNTLEAQVPQTAIPDESVQKQQIINKRAALAAKQANKKKASKSGKYLVKL